MYNRGWGYPDDFKKNCDSIISKTGTDLGDANIFFEWQTPPSDEQVNKLKKLIDDTIKSFGNKFYINNKK